VLWHELAVLIPMAVVGIAVGAALAHELPVNTMRVFFGGFFLFMSILLVRKGWAAAKANRDKETGRANSSRP